MPPPELLDRPAPASVGSLVLDNLRAEAPVSRHHGPRAEEAYLRGHVIDRQAAQDPEGERAACVELARLLAARGSDLEGATRFARRALSLGDDASLRNELAGWLAGLGEAALAAATLRGLCDPAKPSESARTLVKIGVLLARADDAVGAADALAEAMETEPGDAMAAELLGTLAAWAPEDVSPSRAADAYLEAARRRDLAKEKEAAFEDRLRAVEIAPEHAEAATEMATALTTRGRAAAADEVLRGHARALAKESADGALAVQQTRLLAALTDGDGARAVGAMLDAELEVVVEGELADKVDDALVQAGLFELCAVRLEARGERQQGKARAQTYEALARLCSGPLASPDRALEAWIEAASSDPSAGAPRAVLREHAAQMHDPGPLLEALIRIGEGTQGGPGDRIAALKELVTLADDKIADPALALWGLAKLAEAGADADIVKTESERQRARLRQQEESLAAAKRALEGASTPEARFDALRRIATIYRGRPAERAAHLQTLAELCAALPGERVVWLALERLSARANDVNVLEDALNTRIVNGPPRGDLVRARLMLASIARRRGDDSRALDEVLPLLTEAPGHRAAACAVLFLATRVGRAGERASALAQLAGPAQPGLKATLLAAAAEIAGNADAHEQARELAEQAVLAEPTNARAVATMAAIAGPEVDRAGATAVERAMGIVLPRGELCDQLAQALEALGEPALALAWTQRWLALRPGSPRAMEELLRRSILTDDAARLTDSLGWVLAQPKPLGRLATLIVDGLEALFALDRAKARGIAKRVLDVLGPRSEELRSRLLELAARSNDPGLGIAVRERYIAVEPGAPGATEALLELAALRLSAADFDGAARELARAAEGEANPDRVLDGLDALEKGLREVEGVLTSDGRIAVAEARALAYTNTGPEAATVAANAWRDVGSLRWDLAEDQEGAEDAFFAASLLQPDLGVERYARDLCEFAGVAEAVEVLIARAEGLRDREEALEESPRSRRTAIAQPADQRKLQATLLIEAANLAYSNGDHLRALEAAAGAINVDPSRADAIAVVEKCAHVEGGIGILDATYRTLGAAALGCYGRRAAHYRAARQLERRGALGLAVSHALLSFEAVPSEGTSYVLVARLAERANASEEVMSTLERVAEQSTPSVKAMWLRRAASHASRDREGAERRLDLLLGAMRVRPEPSTVQEVGAAVIAIVAVTGDMDEVSRRVDFAMRECFRELEGPDGARAAVAMAGVALGIDADELAIAALDRAMDVDGDIDEFARLAELAPKISVIEGAAAWLKRVLEHAAQPYSSVGAPLLGLAAKVADAQGHPREAATLLIQAAKRAPDDDALVDGATLAVERLEDPDLVALLDQALPTARRLEALQQLALEQEQSGDDATAARTLERAVASSYLVGDERQRVIARLRDLYARLGRASDTQDLLEGEMRRPSVSVPTRLGLARDLAAHLTSRRDHRGAVAALLDGAPAGLLDDRVRAEIRGIAEREGDPKWLADVLELLAERAPEEAKLTLLRELAPLRAELGDRDGAMQVFETIAALDPEDTRATELLERDANTRGDHATIAALLAKRIDAAKAPEQRRMLRLRRVAVLEQRLGQVDEAMAELHEMLSEQKDDVSALRYLADIQERRGEKAAAAQTLKRLGALASNMEEKADFGLRAARASLEVKETGEAESIVAAIAQFAEREAILELRVGIARANDNLPGLAEALDQLASSSRDSAEKRADLLLESARLAARLGDEPSALDRSRRAAKLNPANVEAILEARRLEYRLAGTGAPREAQAAVLELQRIAPQVPAALLDLHAFLLAEELDVYQGGNAGMRELQHRHAEIGSATLVALGMAERLVRGKNFAAAVPLFERALGGDLRGMRTAGRVALAAADAAKVAGELDLAAKFLAQAALEGDTRVTAHRRQLELEASSSDPSSARAALDKLLDQSTGVDRARVLAQLARLLEAESPEEAERLLAEAEPLSVFDRGLRSQITEARAKLDGPRSSMAGSSAPPASQKLEPPGVVVAPLESPRPPKSPPPPPTPLVVPPPPAVPVVRPRATPTPPPLPVEAKAGAAEPHRVLEELPRVGLPKVELPSSSDAPKSDAPRSDAPKSDAPKVDSTRSEVEAPPASRSTPPESGPLRSEAFPQLMSPIPEPPPSVVMPQAEAEEEVLWRQLMAGSYEAGDQLIARLEVRGERRAGDVLSIRRKQASLHLADTEALARLREAALADHNAGFAKAIEHVQGTLSGTPSPLAPPPLAAQRDAPDLLKSLLFRSGLDATAHEALALVWETGLYRREANPQVLAGTERVALGSAGPVAEVYSAVARLLDLVRTALYVRRIPGPPEVRFALASPPIVILSTEVREESAELRYVLGSSLAGATSEHILVNGLDEEQLRTLLEALLAAFGPIGAIPKGNAKVARLGQDLWQLVPPRAERRLRELCANAEAFDPEIVLAGTQQAMRRAGLFASGHLPTALQHTARAIGFELASPPNLAEQCAEHPALADLLRLSIRPELAEARWQSTTGAERRRDSTPRPRAGT